jgi:hypothetical protein
MPYPISPIWHTKSTHSSRSVPRAGLHSLAPSVAAAAGSSVWPPPATATPPPPGHRLALRGLRQGADWPCAAPPPGLRPPLRDAPAQSTMQCTNLRSPMSKNESLAIYCIIVRSTSEISCEMRLFVISGSFVCANWYEDGQWWERTIGSGANLFALLLFQDWSDQCM